MKLDDKVSDISTEQFMAITYRELFNLGDVKISNSTILLCNSQSKDKRLETIYASSTTKAW
jgi:hypothetical protein